MRHHDDYDYLETWDNWNDPFASDGPCPWGGLGNYVPADEICDFKCHFRSACIATNRRAKQENQGKIWRKLFDPRYLHLKHGQSIEWDTVYCKGPGYPYMGIGPDTICPVCGHLGEVHRHGNGATWCLTCSRELKEVCRHD